MEKLDVLIEEMRDKIQEHVEKTTGNTEVIVGAIFDEVKNMCQKNNIPMDYKKVEEIIEDNINKNHDILKERADFIVDCVGKEIIEQEQSKDLNKYAVIDNNAYVKAENVDGKNTVDDTQKIVDQLKSDLTEIKEHITSLAESAGIKSEDIQYINDSIDKKIEGLEAEGGMGDNIYIMLRTDKEDLIKDTVEEYARMEKELKEAEKNQENDSKKNEFKENLDVTKNEGLSLEEQNEFSKETIQKLEDIKENQQEKEQQGYMLRGDVIE